MRSPPNSREPSSREPLHPGTKPAYRSRQAVPPHNPTLHYQRTGQVCFLKLAPSLTQAVRTAMSTSRSGCDSSQPRYGIDALRAMCPRHRFRAHGCASDLSPEANMVASFFQKPIGAVTLLGTAIGAPYAIFETDAGTSARVALQQWVSTNPAAPPIAPGGDASAVASTGGSTPWNATLTPNVTTSVTTDPNFSSASFPAGTLVTPVGSPVLYNNYPGNGTGTPASTSPAFTSVQPQPPTIAGYPTSYNTPNYPAPAYSAAGGHSPLMGSMAPGTPSNPYAPPMTTSGPIPVNGTAPMASPFPGANPMVGANQFPPNAWNPGYATTPPALPYAPATPGTPPPTTASNGHVNDFREVIRFDISPSFVTQRFDRITTVLSSVQLDGMRVAFVSGTRTTDIAGTLTYFFDIQQTVQRIQFQGTTGDASVLSQLMVQYYRLTPEDSLGGHFFTTRWNGQVTSLMLISPAPVMTADSPLNRYSIFLELNQPSHQYSLSQEANQILVQIQARKR
jgi:hypothetical protein